VEARVLNLNFVDGVINVSLDPKVIARTIFSVRDIQPGMMVTGEVLAVLDAGVLVQLADNIKALVPTAHLGDTTVSRPSKQYPVGKSVSCRVLAISKKQRVTLTCKKTLLKKDLSVIDSFAKATPGLVTYGVVTQVKEYGCKIQFFGHVQGILPIRDIKKSSGLEEGQVPSDVFAEGQLVQVRVVSADAEKRKMQLSMSLVAHVKMVDDPTKLRAGRIVSGTVSGTQNDDEEEEDEDEEETKDAATRVKEALLGEEGEEGETKEKKKKIKKKYLLVTLDGHEGVVARVQDLHLTDHPQLASGLFRAYETGDKLEKLLVLWTNKRGGAMCSAKPSLLAAAGTEALPHELRRIQEGSVLHGYVRSVTKLGVFVGFLRSVVGLAPRAMLSDHFVSNPSDHFYEGQSVRAKVESMDVEEKKLLLSLKPSSVRGAMLDDAGFVASFVADRKRIEEKRAKEGVEWSKYAVGSKVPFTVTHMQPTFVVGKLEEGVNTLAMRPLHTGKEDNHTVGNTVSCRVLDVDRAKAIVDVTCSPDLLAAVQESEAKSSKKRKAKELKAPAAAELPEVGKSVAVVLQLVKDQYFVMTLPDYGHVTGIATTSDYNQRLSLHSVFKPGFACQALVTALPAAAGDYVQMVINITQKIEKEKRKALKVLPYTIPPMLQGCFSLLSPLLSLFLSFFPSIL
jgi:rRNA biogenesis protein RRP5